MPTGYESGKAWSPIGAQATVSTSAASRVWTLNEVAAYEGAGTWPAPAVNWEVIQTTSATVNTATISFTSIPQTYRDLKIVYAGTSPDAEYQLMNFATGGGSPDTTNANYGVMGMMVYSSGSNNAGWYITESAWRKFPTFQWPQSGFPNVGIFDIPNYTSTSFYKVAQSWSSNRSTTSGTGSSGNGGGMTAFYTWKNTGALDRIDMTRDAGSGYDDFTCTLFGIGG